MKRVLAAAGVLVIVAIGVGWMAIRQGDTQNSDVKMTWRHGFVTGLREVAVQTDGGRGCEGNAAVKAGTTTITVLCDRARKCARDCPMSVKVSLPEKVSPESKYVDGATGKPALICDGPNVVPLTASECGEFSGDTMGKKDGLIPAT